MPYISVQIDKKSAELVRQGLQNLNNEIPKIGRLQLYQTAQAIVRRMKEPGAEVTYPVQWDTNKQRKAFFASGGFGKGIPYKRNEDYESGWDTKKIDTGYQVYNPKRKAAYIGGNAYGLGQSRIHAGRWPLLRDVADEEIEKLPQQVQDNLKIVARRGGLETK